MLFRVGFGSDLHRLVLGDGLMLGGVSVESEFTAVAHSDGDVLLHTLTDAILGAVGEPDIGELFPDNAEENRGRSSVEFLREALRLAGEKGFLVGNVDVTVQLQKPKLSIYKMQIRENLAEICRCKVDAVSIKAKTGEGIGEIGESRAIAAQAVVLMRSFE